MGHSVLAYRLFQGVGLWVQCVKPLFTKLVCHSGTPVGVPLSYL